LVLLLLGGCNSDPTSPQPPAGPSHDLLFEGTQATTPELWLRDADTGDIRRLLPEGTIAKDPAPSPDGARIAFVVSDEDASTGDIFVVNRDGTGLLQITHDPALDDQPAWSPDGQRIAFRSYRTQRDGDIWLMNADGTNPVNLTPDPLPGIWDERRPSWSPDGTRIAFATNAGGNVDIWTMQDDGTDPQRLTNTVDLDTEPSWSPDGATIAFRRSSNDLGTDICVVPARGGETVRLTLPGVQRTPTWTPDGTRLVFVNHATTSDRPDLYSMRPDGTDVTPVVAEEVPGGCLNPEYLKRR
jgi:Tol biopolymer transport system component